MTVTPPGLIDHVENKNSAAVQRWEKEFYATAAEVIKQPSGLDNFPGFGSITFQVFFQPGRFDRKTRGVMERWSDGVIEMERWSD